MGRADSLEKTLMLGKIEGKRINGQQRMRWLDGIIYTITSLSIMEGMMVKLKPQYFGYLMRRVDSLEKTLMLGGIGGRRRRG